MCSSDLGVAAENIERTGFPLPRTLVAGAEAHTAARIDRLTRGAPLRIVAAIGGAAAQLDRLGALLDGRPAGSEVDVFLGLRPDLAVSLPARFGGPGVRWYGAVTFEEHATSFAEALARADVLWTKPSELSFYAALGLPLALSPPLGVQEERNRAWLERAGVLVEAPDLGWLDRNRDRLVEAAERGLTLDRGGTVRIAAMV